MGISFLNLEVWGLVGDEADALHLANVVESDDTDEAVGVCSLSLLKLLQHLRSISATKHRMLPYGLVGSIIVSW